MSLYLSSLPSIITTVGTVSAAGLGISGTVMAKNYGFQSETLESQAIDLKSKIEDLQERFKDFPDMLKATMDIIKSSSPVIQELNGKLDIVTQGQGEVDKKSESLKSQVDEFFKTMGTISGRSESLNSSVQTILGKLLSIETQSKDNLQYSASAMRSAEGAEGLVGKASSWIDQLIKEFGGKIEASIEKKKQELRDKVEKKIEELRARVSKEKEEFKSSLNVGLGLAKIELKKTDDYVKDTLSNLGSVVEESK